MTSHFKVLFIKESRHVEDFITMENTLNRNMTTAKK